MSAEVLVIGGGPAGLATAIAAAQAGLSVEVAEPLAHAIDKCCGEGLLPPAVRALALLGIPEQQLAAVGSPFFGLRFYHDGQQASACFSRASPAYGVRRTDLHRLLRQRALEAGVRLLEHSARLCGGREEQRVMVGDSTRNPRWIVGADGAQSAVRRDAGLAESRTRSRRFAMRQHFKSPPDAPVLSAVEVYWARGAQAYVTPAGENRVGVAVVASERLPSMHAALDLFPALRERLGEAQSCSTARGALSYHRTLKRVYSGKVALVGDAAGSVDAVTGDGLALAFAQALLLGEAMRRGDLSGYADAHARLLRPARVMSRALLAMGSRPIATRGSMLLLGRVPGLFPALLRLHTYTPVTNRLNEENAPWQPAHISTRSTM